MRRKKEENGGKGKVKGRCSARGREGNVGVGGLYSGGSEENLSQTAWEREREGEPNVTFLCSNL